MARRRFDGRPRSELPWWSRLPVLTLRIPVLALILTIASAAPALAQMSYGVKAGINYADVSFDGDVASSGRVGLLAGGFVTLPLRGWLAAQSEVIYTVKGTSVDIADIETDFIVDYVEVPLLARISFRKNMYVAGGPSMAFRSAPGAVRIRRIDRRDRRQRRCRVVRSRCRRRRWYRVRQVGLRWPLYARSERPRSERGREDPEPSIFVLGRNQVLRRRNRRPAL